MSGTVRVVPVPAGELEALGHLTFPAVLSAIAPFFPETLAFAAFRDDEPVGLVIGVRGPNGEFEVLSLFVSALSRRQGIGSRLLALLEKAFAAAGMRRGVHFLTVRSEEQGPVRFAMRQGWARPTITKLVCRSTIQNAFETPWLVRAKLPSHYAIRDWARLTPRERAALRAGVGDWIPEEVDPFAVEAGFDRATSVALVDERKSARPVSGFVVTHRVASDTLRWTCSYVDPALQGSARILPLWLEVASRQRVLRGPEEFVFTVPLTQPRMARFAAQHMRPWLTDLAYSCITTKNVAMHRNPDRA